MAVFLDRMRVVFRGVNDAVRRATEDAANRKLEILVAERVAFFAIDHPTYATKEQTTEASAAASAEALSRRAPRRRPVRTSVQADNEPTIDRVALYHEQVSDFGSRLASLNGGNWVRCDGSNTRLTMRNSAEANDTIKAVDLAGQTRHLLQLSQCVEAAALFAIADDLEPKTLQRGKRVDFLRGGGVDVDAVRSWRDGVPVL